MPDSRWVRWSKCLKMLVEGNLVEGNRKGEYITEKQIQSTARVSACANSVLQMTSKPVGASSPKPTLQAQYPQHFLLLSIQ
jgi:hypothetical protein